MDRNRIIVYVDDANHAAPQIAQLRASGLRPSHWVLAACAPRMANRVSKWVSHSARENWRAKWLARTEEALLPVLQEDGARITTVLAQGSLPALTQRLLLEHGAARVIDMRRPRVGGALEPVQATPAQGAKPRGGFLSGGMMGLGALLMLAYDLAE